RADASETQTITLPAGSTTAAGLAGDLHTAVRGASTSEVFSRALAVRLDDDSVLLIPGEGATIPVVTAAPDDPEALVELGMETRRPSIAGNYVGTLAAPPTSLVCVTVFGRSVLRS